MRAKDLLASVSVLALGWGLAGASALPWGSVLPLASALALGLGSALGSV